MKKNFKYYMITWGVLLALFNLITFIIPPVPGVVKFTDSFWIGYAFIMLAFVGQLVCSLMVFKHDEYRMAFYNITLLKSSFTGLIISFVAGSLCMIIPFPYWLSVIICAVILVINVLSVVKSKVAIDAVAGVDTVIVTKATKLVDCAFYNCSMLDSIKINISAKSNIGKNAFVNSIEPIFY